jgi:mannose-6-phosphate isomerase-like protein (cupin superfamily)
VRAEVRKATAVEEIESQERCYVTEVANDSGDEFVAIARVRVEAEVTTALHCLKGVSERYLILAGVGGIELSGLSPVEVAGGDVVRIPPDTPQRIHNIGASDLIFYCVCTPPFNSICYEGLERPRS